VSAEDRGTEEVSKESFFEVSVPVGVTRPLINKTVGQIRTCVSCSDQRRDYREIGLYLQNLNPSPSKETSETVKKPVKQKIDSSNIHIFLKRTQ